jgi:integrase
MTYELRKLHKESGAGDEELIFTAERGGRIIPSNLTSRVLKPAAVRAGLGEWVHAHTFRHSVATRLLNSGWSLVQVAKFLSHSDPGFTARTYIHLTPEDLPTPDTAFAFLNNTGQPDTQRETETLPRSQASLQAVSI